MLNKGSLRRRIVAAYVLLACAVWGTFAVAAFFLIATIEDRLIDQRLSRAADQLIDRQQRGINVETPPHVVLYRAESIPLILRKLAPGKYELMLDGDSVNVLVREHGGERFVLVDNDSDFESIKGNIYVTLGASLFACLVLAVLLGRVTASRVIAPVTALARAVEQDDGTLDLPSLTSRDEMGVLARAFATRADELRKFLLRERWFVGDVSHELRTPLTIILGAAEVLCARVGDRTDLLPVAERIRRTAADTTERVGAMLLLSRAPEMVDAPRIALSPLIRQEIERCQPFLVGKPVTLYLDAPQEIHVFARPELAAIAIGNLIRNACQFTEQGQVRVTLGDGRLVVEDTGGGIPPVIRDRLFERFVRASTDLSTGSGLGLAIVRRVAEHLEWTVSLEDPPGGGSRFILTLPSTS